MGATQSTTSTCVHETPRGHLTGKELFDLSGKPIYKRFTKIPYALPPVGKLRWRRPQPLPPDYSLAGDYTTFGPVSPQPPYEHNTVLLETPSAVPEPENQQCEDCLYLNVWIPSGEPPGPGWPVQFFIRRSPFSHSDPIAASSVPEFYHQVLSPRGPFETAVFFFLVIPKSVSGVWYRVPHDLLFSIKQSQNPISCSEVPRPTSPFLLTQSRRWLAPSRQRNAK